MLDTRLIAAWLREDAKERLRKHQEEVASDPFKEPLRSTEQSCPSCNLTKGRHAYYCALAFPEDKDVE